MFEVFSLQEDYNEGAECKSECAASGPFALYSSVVFCPFLYLYEM